jgi:hypothetical protein
VLRLSRLISAASLCGALLIQLASEMRIVLSSNPEQRILAEAKPEAAYSSREPLQLLSTVNFPNDADEGHVELRSYSFDAILTGDTAGNRRRR